MTIFEELEIEYEKRDGLLYPVLAVENDAVNISSVGKYGRMWIRFMEGSYPDRYRHLMRIGRMSEIANDVNEQAYEIFDMLQEKYLNRHKERMSGEFMEHVRLLDQAGMTAEEIVLAEVVNQFH